MTDTPIPAGDLPLVSPGALDSVVGVQLGQTRRFPLASVSPQLGYLTRAALYADLAHEEGTIRRVTNDSTTSYNGDYIKVGASGAGSWTKATDRVTTLEAQAAYQEQSGEALSDFVDAYYDVFNRADGAIGTASSGDAWSVVAGTVSVASNKASGVDGTAILDIGVADVDVTGVFDPIGSSGNVRLIARYVDASNYLFVITIAGGVRLYKLEAGLLVSLVSATGYTLGTSVSIRILAKGQNVKVYLDGTEAINHTLSNADFAAYGAGTGVGMRLRSTSRATSFVAREADIEADDRLDRTQLAMRAAVSPAVHRLSYIARREHGVSATITMPDYGFSFPGGGVTQFRGAVVAGDGTTYCITRDSGFFILIEQDGTVISDTLGLSGPELLAMNVSGGCLGPDGKIYCPPRDSDEVLVIDPFTRTATLTDFGADLTTSNGVTADKWTGAVLAPNGLIYCLPTSGRDILIIDPFTQTARKETFGLAWDASKQFAGGALGPDGKIYLPPYNNVSPPIVGVMVIDPFNETATFEDFGLGASIQGLARWSGTVTGADGKIYCCPRQAGHVLVIDPFQQTAELKDYGLTMTDGDNKWTRFINGPDGKLYATPADATEILVVDPIDDSAILTDFGTTIPTLANKWIGGAQAPNGKIYCTPDQATFLLVIEPLASEPWPIDLLLSPLWNKSP